VRQVAAGKRVLTAVVIPPTPNVSLSSTAKKKRKKKIWRAAKNRRSQKDEKEIHEK
jgi:hypothetical protein